MKMKKMIQRIINKINEKKSNQYWINVNKDILNLLEPHEIPFTIYGFCKKYNIEKKHRYIGYIVGTTKRKLNIAKKMEQEEYIEKYREVLNNYKKQILREIPYQ